MARVRQLMLGLASGSALYSGMAPALGLGDITLHSALNQPFEAEMERFAREVIPRVREWAPVATAGAPAHEIGRASCRERV